MNLLLMADGKVGSSILQYLLDAYPSDLRAIVVTSENEVYQAAQRAGIPVCVFSMDPSCMQWIRDKGDYQLGVLAWWPHIIKAPLIRLPSLGFINTHPSFLPYNRGKHYNFWALVEQSPFGVSLHRVDEGVDSGDILEQLVIPYDWTDNGETLYHKAQGAILSLFRTAYPRLRAGQIRSRRQDRNEGSFHHSSEIELASRIDLDSQYSGRQILNLLRARTFEGRPACWFKENGEKYEVKVKIKRVE